MAARSARTVITSGPLLVWYAPCAERVSRVPPASIPPTPDILNLPPPQFIMTTTAALCFTR